MTDLALPPSLLAPAKVSRVCPRCGHRLGPETDRDYGWCINHGPVFIGVAMDIPENHRIILPGGAPETDGVRPETTHLYSVRVAHEEAKRKAGVNYDNCIDCGKAKTRNDSPRCRPCANRYTGSLLRNRPKSTR